MVKINMKIVVMIIVILTVFISMIFMGDFYATHTYELEQLDRNEVCDRRLNVYFSSKNGVGIGLEEGIYNKEIANEITQKVNSDIRMMESAFLKRFNESINILIIERPLSNGAYIGENYVYCTLEEIRNNTYREALVRASYNLTEPAIIHGLTGYIFDASSDIDQLKAFYSEEEDLGILGLFGGRFYEQWNTEKEIKLAKDTAVALMRYMIETGHQDVVLTQEITVEQKRNWLESIGVVRKYDNPYDGKLMKFKYSQSDEYALIIESQQERYYMTPVEGLLTTKDIESFLYKQDEGKKYILRYLEENTSTDFEEASKNINQEYYFVPNLYKGGLARQGGKIYLKHPSVDLHEYVHALVGRDCSFGNLWVNEGFAEYLSKIVYPGAYEVDKYFEKIAEDKIGQSDRFQKDTMAYYKEKGGKFEKESINTRLFYDAVAYYTLKYGEELMKDESLPVKAYGVSISEAYNISEEAQKEGDELTYAQASSFTAYLIEHYSLDRYLAHYIGGKSFENAFGLPYTKAKQDWMNALK